MPLPSSCLPEWVMLSNAPVAFRCTRMSFDLARRIRGPRAPERAILALFSSWVARFVMHPTALHCTSTFGDIIWRIRGFNPPRVTINTLFSAVTCQRPEISPVQGKCREMHTIHGQIAQRGAGSSLHFNVGALEEGEDGVQGVTVDLTNICR